MSKEQEEIMISFLNDESINLTERTCLINDLIAADIQQKEEIIEKMKSLLYRDKGRKNVR